MPFQRPTIAEIKSRIQGDLKAELGLTTILRRSFLSAISTALAGVAHSLHGHLVYVSKQMFVSLADIYFVKLQASIDGFTLKEATFAKLTLSGSGVDATVIAAGTGYKRSDGLTYTTDADATIVGGTFLVNVTADEAGATYNMPDGDSLNLSSPIAGVDSLATVSATLAEAEDKETDEDFRARYLNFKRNPPQGGAVNDYATLTLEVAGLTRAFVLPGFFGEGSIGVTALEGTAIPSGAKIDELQAYLELKGSAVASITAFAPTETVLDLTINIKPFTTAVQNAVTAELQALIDREAQVAGSYKKVGATFDGKIPISKIREAISTAAGEEDHAVISPTVDTIPPAGGIVTLGTITYGELF